MQLKPDILFRNRYRLIEMKGRGSFGEVWLARDEHLHIEVAIKVYVALDDSGCDEFGKEYLRVRSLLHTNLLRAEHYDLYGDRPFLVMEYCPSGAKDLIGKADEITLLHFIRDVASGLAYMHQHDMLHRDIKPDNILRKADGTFVLTDFGLSKNMHSTLLRNSSRNLSADSVDNLFAGTVEYMAPELFTPDPLAVKATDVWALGVTLYEIITGEVPFFGKGGSMMNFGAAVPNIYASLSTNLIDTVRGCMAKDPWDRPTAQQLADWAQSGIDYYNESSYAAKTPSTDTPNPDLLVNADNPETGSDSGNEVLSDLPVEKHHRRIWPWATVAALVVLGIAGLLVWKFAKPKVDSYAEADFFAKCQKSNSIGLYRSYLELYPQGSHIEDVNAWIKQYEDSIVDSNLTPDPVQVTENKPEVQAVSPTEEPKDKGKDNDKNAKEDKKTDKPEANKNEEKPFPKSKADLGELNNEHPSDKSLLTQDDGKGLTESNAGLTNGDLERNEITEERLYKKCTSNSATVEDCLEWMDKYGDANTRDKVKWNVVSTKFLQLYNARLNSCKTVEDYDNFLNNHDRIMRKARLADNTPGSVDDRMRKQAIERRKAAQDKQDQEKGLRITD